MAPGYKSQVFALPAVGQASSFLEYLAPRDGRPYPADARANDLFHWQTTLTVVDASAIEQSLRVTNSRFVSPGSVSLTDLSLGFTKGLLVRDPDGHVMALVESRTEEARKN